MLWNFTFKIIAYEKIRDVERDFIKYVHCSIISNRKTGNNRNVLS